tara:strand:+ start:4039 stop:5535 length:1497 start_codon:yes stop_codon:yes gene_type:complete
MDINVVIPSLGRPKILSERTLKTLGNFPKENIYIFVIPDELELYSSELDGYNVIPSVLGCGESKRLISNFFLENARLVFLDDDIKGFYKKKGSQLMPVEAIELFKTSFAQMDTCNEASLCGIYPSKNPYFMRMKTRKGLSFCIGQYQAVYNKREIFNSFEYNILEDYERSLRYFLDYNVIRLDNYTLDADYNKLEGGWQTESQFRHTELKEKELERFKEQYSDYCYIKTKKHGRDIVFKSLYSKESKVVQTLWIDKGKDTKLLELMLKSWLSHGYTVDLYTNNLELFQHKDINCLSYKIILDVETDCILHFSDLFRYKLLYKYGGIWADADMVMVNDYDFNKVPVLISSEHTMQKGAFKSYDDSKPNIGLLKFQPNNLFFKELINFLETKIPNFDKPNEFMDIFRKKMNKSPLKKYMVEPLFCCPTTWWNVVDMYKDVGVYDLKYGVTPPTLTTILEQSTCCHFWNNFTHNKHQIDLDKAEEGSLYKILLNKYNHVLI